MNALRRQWPPVLGLLAALALALAQALLLAFDGPFAAVARVAFAALLSTAAGIFLALYLRLAARNAALAERLRASEARSEELDKLKSDLIAMLAHDFRGSLTTIIGYAELLKEGLIGGAEVPAAAQTIEGAAWHLTHLAADMLTMSQLERNEVILIPTQVDLVELLLETIHSSKQSARIAFEPAGRTLFAECDARRIHQALDNLIGNALKYSAPEGTVTIVLSREPEWARIAVSDTGIGIPRADLERIFDRFARADNARRAGIKGSGFGLYLSRMLVALHGGTLAVTSVEGHGSTFTLSLPLPPEPPAERERRAEPESKPAPEPALAVTGRR